MAGLAAERMSDTGRPRDLRQHCSLCHFHFWQERKIFYLGRHQDLVSSSKPAELRLGAAAAAGRDEFLFLGEHYLFRFDGGGWRPLARRSGALQHASLPAPASAAAGSPWPVFPVCWNCFRVAREFLVYRNEQPVRGRPSIRTLQGLYAALRAQWAAGGGDGSWSLDWPHRCYRGPFQAYDCFAQPRLRADAATAEPMDDWLWLMGDPYRPLPPLPDFLLAHLHPTAEGDGRELEPAARRGPRQPAAPLLRLPVELVAQVAALLDAPSCFALRLACSQLAAAVPLDQRFWYAKFVHHKLFGFFFDFDVTRVVDEIRKKCERRRKLPPRWDWRRLARDLACFASFENGGVMDDAPLGFRNRRRIWKVLEMAETYHAEVLDRCPPPPPQAPALEHRTYLPGRALGLFSSGAYALPEGQAVPARAVAL